MTETVSLRVRGRTVDVEYLELARARSDAPRIVFLHEGLGSVSAWRDFPDKLCEAAGARGLVYSRPGYGRSTPRAAQESWGVDFMHRQAHELLPALFEALGIDAAVDPPWLFGHSDGGSIALLYAARCPSHVAGVVALAPHVFVEELSLTSIAAARRAYVETDLRARLARHHLDPDSAFYGWNDAWLSPAFRTWNLEADLLNIVAPVLVIQGQDDPYGTLEQVARIEARVPHAERLVLGKCGHAPHREHPEAVVARVAAMVRASPPRVTNRSA